MLGLATPLSAQEIDWRVNGRDTEGTRYSPASVINRDNVARIEVAWTYRTGESDAEFATSFSAPATTSWRSACRADVAGAG